MDYEIKLVELFHTITRRFWKLLGPVMKDAGFSVTDMIMLSMVGKKRTIQATVLAGIIGVPASTCTGILDRLEKHGYLKREQNPVDRRSIVVHATPKLDAMMKGLKLPAENAYHAMFRSIPENRLKRLVEDLQFILDSMDKIECHEPNAHKGEQK